jgi:acetyl/propionyl-CoA carboxylase alpha subunit
METRLRHGTRTLDLVISEEAGDLRVAVDGRAHRVREIATHRPRTADGAEAAEVVLLVDGRTRHAVVVRAGDRLLVALDGRAHTFALGDEARAGAAATGTGIAVAPMPGTVVRVLVAVGDAVEAGTPLVVLEAMKMESTLAAEIPGVVTAVRVAAGAMVDGGEVLVEIGPPAPA